MGAVAAADPGDTAPAPPVHGPPGPQNANVRKLAVGPLTAFVVGQLVDAFPFRRIKHHTGDKRIWLRATGSTVVSQLIDSVVVTYVAFWIFKDMSFPMATALVLTAYTYKRLVAVLAAPLVYAVHAGVEQYLGPERAQAMRAAALRRKDEQ